MLYIFIDREVPDEKKPKQIPITTRAAIEHYVKRKNTPTFPPYNIEKLDEDHFILSAAIAGYNEDDIDINVEDDNLIIKSIEREELDNKVFLHRGIAKRKFLL